MTPNQSGKRARRGAVVGFVALVLFGLMALSCGGVGGRANMSDPSLSDPICNCTPSEPDSNDFRHDAKHVPLPGMPPQEIDINTMLSWPVPPPPAANAPRSGRENQLFHIARGFLQNARIVPVDCDIHLEVSQTADKNAPRVIMETPVSQDYCSSRETIEQQLAQHGFTISDTSGELTPALAIEVVGLAFQDFEHNRGSPQVATTWELHPATADLLP